MYLRLNFRWILAALVLVGGLPARAASSSFDTDHVHVQLLFPGGNYLQSGHNLAGLYFKLEPGWHIYWKNPGDAGEPCFTYSRFICMI